MVLAPRHRRPPVRPRLAVALAVVALAAATAIAWAQSPDPYAEPRAMMVRTISLYAANAPEAVAPGGISDAVLEVMGRTPRHRFVPEWLAGLAYRDGPVPIGLGQTVSQPFIVALMTELAGPAPAKVVLEIGTGSGYQAAVLSPLVRTVCTIEIIPELGQTAAKRLKELGYANIRTRIGDGYFGWPECGPFDAILVTAAAGHVPPPLVEQLKPGGRMVIPVGGVYGPQFLTLVDKAADGAVTTRQVLPVRFVPLTRGPQ